MSSERQAPADTTAVILVGGLGTRLRTVVQDRPKVLALVRGRPFLAYLLDQIEAAGFRSVVLCTGYRGDQVQSEFGNHYGQMRLAYSQESEPLGTAGALRLALPLLGSDSVLVMNGDSYCNQDLAVYWEWHQACAGMGELLLAQVQDVSRYGRVQFDAGNRITEFAEKGAAQGPGWINAGIYLLRRELLQTIPAGRMVSIEHEMFPAWIARGLYGFPTSAHFLDIGTPESYALAEQVLPQAVQP